MPHNATVSGKIDYWTGTYDPSFPTAVVFAVLFTVSAVFTVVQYIKHRSWFFWPAVLAALMESVGFIFRAISAHDHTLRNVYIVQYCMILLAPAIMAGGAYMVFGRLLFWIVPLKHHRIRELWVPPRWITPIFVCGDILSFAIQMIGAVMISAAEPGDDNYKDRVNSGMNVVKIGLIVQLLFFGFFSVVGVRFLFVAKRYCGKTVDGKRWQYLNYAVNVSCLAILVRSIYRTVEFASGNDNTVETHEVYFWILDALMMIGVLVSFNVFHPGRFLPNVGFRQRSNLPPRDDVEQVELKPPGTSSSGPMMPASGPAY